MSELRSKNGNLYHLFLKQISKTVRPGDYVLMVNGRPLCHTNTSTGTPEIVPLKPQPGLSMDAYLPALLSRSALRYTLLSFTWHESAVYLVRTDPDDLAGTVSLQQIPQDGYDDYISYLAEKATEKDIYDRFIEAAINFGGDDL